ncbi:MAG: hypothetical protein E6Q88_10270 [Lysobacteraceae bacterium]|nr:MAG: hypothetical protein E6Q88_10270 [Xanthomonadaceae bacterium]
MPNFTASVKYIVILGVPLLYMASCQGIGFHRQRTYEAVVSGQSESAVLSAMGEPSHTEIAQSPYLKYASTGCLAPCVKRMWYENPLSFDIEAWSFEFDAQQQLIQKQKWFSP